MNDHIKATVVSNGSTPEEDWNPFHSEEEFERNNRALIAGVDPDTGEVLSDEIMIYQGQPEPEYLVKFRQLELPTEQGLALLSMYESQANSKQFKSLVNTNVLIYGGIIWDHPPYRAKGTTELDPLHPGYKKILFLSLDKEGEPFIIEASEGRLSMHARNIFNKAGWFLFTDGPVEYKFAVSERTGAFEMYNQSRVKSMLLAMKPEKKAKQNAV